MQGIPLHPAIVHIPIGLAVAMPLVASAVALALFKGWVRKPAWAIVVGLQALVLVGGLVAMETGEDEEEAVERVVDERFIEEHEERAEGFVWAAGITLAFAAAGLVVGPERLAMVAAATSIATLVTLAQGYRVGHSGGELVFKHGAAAAYTDAAPKAVGSAPGHDD
jgi:uncharacterized membrane protein